MLFLSLEKGLKFESYVCNGCHDILQIFINFNDVFTLHINGANYRCIIDRICKTYAVNILQNSDLTEKTRAL